MIKRVFTMVLLVLLVNLCGLGCCLNNSPVDYMKTIHVQKEGYDGITIYFILADKNGRSTASNGTMDLTITDSKTRIPMLFLSGNVSESDFVEATLGLGAFAHNDTILYLGRIPYSKMYFVPSDEYAKGDVTIVFTTPDNRSLEGTESVYLR